jgi:hypothetical protein
MTFKLLIAALTFSLAARADFPAPSMAHATPEASLPHPHVPLPPRPPAEDGLQSKSKAAPYAGWLFPTEPHKGFDALRVTMSPRDCPTPEKNSIYWAYDGNFLDNSTWYEGLQPNGEFGRTALFSVFGPGTEAKHANCKSGADGGAGTHCHIHYDWQVGHSYEFTVALVAADGELSRWEGAIFDLATGARTVIGEIAVPASRGHLKAVGMTFSEYFHRITSCAEQPHSEVLFYAPVGYRDGKEYLGKLHSMNANAGCHPKFHSDGSGFVFIENGTKN